MRVNTFFLFFFSFSFPLLTMEKSLRLFSRSMGPRVSCVELPGHNFSSNFIALVCAYTYTRENLYVYTHKIDFIRFFFHRHWFPFPLSFILLSFFYIIRTILAINFFMIINSNRYYYFYRCNVVRYH